MSLQLLISSLYLPATAAALLKDYVEDRQSTRGAATTVTASSFVDKSRNMLDSGSGSDSDPDSDPDSDERARCSRVLIGCMGPGSPNSKLLDQRDAFRHAS